MLSRMVFEKLAVLYVLPVNFILPGELSIGLEMLLSEIDISDACSLL